MKSKKTIYIWVLIVLEIINIPIILLSLFADLYIGNPTLGKIGMLLNMIALIITLIWLHRAFLLKKDLIRWTNINFGFGILLLLFSSLSIYLNTGNIESALLGNVILMIITLIIWITFVMHIKKSVSTNKIQLS